MYPCYEMLLHREKLIQEIVKKERTATEVAEILGVQRETVSRWLAKYRFEGLDGICPKKPGPKSGSAAVNRTAADLEELVLPEIRSALEEDKPIIIDGCFYHKEQIEHFIQNLDAPCFIFTLKAALEVCIERDKGREKSYGEGAAWAVHSMVSKFDYGHIINTEGKSSDEVTQEILTSI